MKNIYLVPTTQKTLLFKDHTGFYFSQNLQTPSSINSSVSGCNMYITNDEKNFELSDIVYNILSGLFTQWGHVKNTISPNLYKKIVFTTNPDLSFYIKNVPDKFLEYFCEKSNAIGEPIGFIELQDNKFIYPELIVKPQSYDWTASPEHPMDIRLNEFQKPNPEEKPKFECDKIIEDLICKKAYEKSDTDLEDYAEGLKDGYQLLHKTFLDNMQYYMEYCKINEYVTPQEWLDNHKHF
jgi:hypothetical protein